MLLFPIVLFLKEKESLRDLKKARLLIEIAIPRGLLTEVATKVTLRAKKMLQEQQ